MNTRLFLYGAWCLAILGGFVMAANAGYSPFADGRRAPMRAGGGYYGPTHK